MRTLYLECRSGISGDMFSGAMIALGVDEKKLINELAKLGLNNEYEIVISDIEKSGVMCKHFDVILDQQEHDHHEHDDHHEHHDHEYLHEHDDHQENHEHHHRTYADIRDIINKSELSDYVKTLSLKIFMIVAEAEGRVHGLAPDKVHFHEVGAVDSIVDIVSAAICLEQLKPQRIVCSTISEGSGQVKCAHGLLPVPAPATAEIFKAYKMHFEITNENGEMVTPTGAAIAAAIVDGFGNMPQMSLEKIGYSCGKREFKRANILRAFIGETEDDASVYHDSIAVLETSIDDSTGETLGFCIEKLFAEGAADAYYTPVFMKKGRPAYMLTVMCSDELKDKMAETVFEMTGAAGLRYRRSERIIMQREIKKIATEYGEIDFKIYRYKGVSKVKLEYESVKKAAQMYDIPINKLYNVLLKTDI